MRLSGILAIGCAIPLTVVAAQCGGDDNPVGGAGGAVAGSGGSTAAGSGGAAIGGSSGSTTAGSGGSTIVGAGGYTTMGGAGGGMSGAGGGLAGAGGGMSGAGGGVAGAGGGVAGMGGAAAVDGGVYACEGLKPSTALITDFAVVDTLGAFTTTGGYSGRIFTYPATMTVAMTPTFSMAGTVSNYTGFGIYLSQCVDASAYGGISFTVGGTVGSPATLMLQLKMNSTTPVSAATKHGACIAKDPLNTYADCWDPVAWVTVPATPATVTVQWAQFAGGKPTAAAVPSEILGFQWSFNWAGATGVAYPVSVTLDDLTFVQ